MEGIRERETFERLRSHGRRGRAGALTIVRTARPHGEQTAVAFSIRRQVGTAVRRNRIRRQMKEILGDLERRGDLHGDALLVIVSPHSECPSYATLREWTERALEVTA